ncbi:MAG: ABC transporter permease [Porphyromonas sp.]|nr:ABC transporter permease [Porphyromonas sp.]
MNFYELRISSFVAWRYFFSKKSTNAVNVIATVAVIGVALVTTAMICVLSVFNGFENFTTSQLSPLSPKYIIKSANDQVFTVPRQLSGKVAPVLTTQAVVRFEENYTLATLVGIDSLYKNVVSMTPYMFDGEFNTGDLEMPTAVIGIGVGSRIDAGAGYWTPLEVTVPNRVGEVSNIFPAKNFQTEGFHIAGVFRIDQPGDDELIFIDISVLQKLLQYDEHMVTYIALGEETAEAGALSVCAQLGDDFQILNKYEQHPEIYKVLRLEKWFSFLLLFFVLLLSVFSFISTLGMLIIEKRNDAITLRVLGAPAKLVDRIIILEGWLLSITGLIIGGLLGILLVVLQSRFGILKLGGGESMTSVFLIDAYPVELRIVDLLIVSLFILMIGWLSSVLAYKFFRWNRPK